MSHIFKLQNQGQYRRLQNVSSMSSVDCSKKFSVSLVSISLNKARSSSFPLNNNPLSKLRPRLWLVCLGSLPGEHLNAGEGGISAPKLRYTKLLPRHLHTLQNHTTVDPKQKLHYLRPANRKAYCKNNKPTVTLIQNPSSVRRLPKLFPWPNSIRKPEIVRPSQLKLELYCLST